MYEISQTLAFIWALGSGAMKPINIANAESTRQFDGQKRDAESHIGKKLDKWRSNCVFCQLENFHLRPELPPSTFSSLSSPAGY